MNENLLTIKATIVAFFTAVGAFLGWRMIMVLVWVVLMLLDWVSGSAAARHAGEWKSEKARDGIWHKGGMILVFLVALIADFILLLVSEQFPHDILPFEWPMALMPLVVMWYIVTEMGSILENAIKMGADIPSWMPKLLNATLNVVDTAGEKFLDNADKDTGADATEYAEQNE